MLGLVFIFSWFSAFTQCLAIILNVFTGHPRELSTDLFPKNITYFTFIILLKENLIVTPMSVCSKKKLVKRNLNEFNFALFIIST